MHVDGFGPPAELDRKQVNLQALDQSINTGDATGRLLFNMLGAIAQFETEIRAERQMDGIWKAKERDARFGREKKSTPTPLYIWAGIFMLCEIGVDKV